MSKEIKLYKVMQTKLFLKVWFTGRRQGGVVGEPWSPTYSLIFDNNLASNLAFSISNNASLSLRFGV
jgi:hypothetical protein